MIFRIFLAFFVVPSTLFVCSFAQRSEPPPFGWSLRVEAESKQKKDQKKDRAKPIAPRVVQEAGEDGEIKIESTLILSDVLVLNGKGVPVSGLTVGDFEITEDGRSQSIDVFAAGSSSIPRSIFLVIDHSLSQWRYIDKTVDAAKTLVNDLRPSDRMAIISDDVSLLSELTGDKETLLKDLESLRKKCHGGSFGQSRQYSALYAVLNEKIERNGTRNIVIFQTDGDELSTLGTGLNPLTFENLFKTANRKGATVYSVYTGPRLKDKNKKERIEIARSVMADEAKAFHLLQRKERSFRQVSPSETYLLARADRLQVEENALSDIAIKSGGIAQTLESADQAAGIYQNILSDIGSRYLIGYYLPDERRDNIGKEREVKISLRAKDGYKVVGGRTYVMY